MMKEKVVIIGANDFQNPLILKAKKLGYETHVFAWKDGSIGEKTADYFYPISIVEKEEILSECKKINPKAVVSIGSDLATITVNYVANHLGLPCNDPNITLQCTNKYEMRKKFLEKGVPVPKFLKTGKYDEFSLNNFKFPVIVKPTDRSGSRGIFLCNNIQEVKNAIKESSELSFEKKAIIEEFIDGKEYSCECITQNGEHHFLAITKKYTTGSPNFIETGHIQPSSLDKKITEKIVREIFKALDALQIKNSASHSEFKIDKNGNIRIIEIGARMGGDCIGSDLIKISTGYDFLELTLKVALGEKIKLEKINNNKIAIIKFFFNEKDLETLKIIEKKFPKNLYSKSNIKVEKNDIMDSSSRYGYFILECTKQELIEIKKELKLQKNVKLLDWRQK